MDRQRVEAFKIMELLGGRRYRPFKHPMVIMWDGYYKALLVYYNICLTVWEERGFKNTGLKKINTFGTYGCPTWIYNRNLNLSHRSNLIRRNPEFYKRLWPEVPDNIPYLWTSQKDLFQ